MEGIAYGFSEDASLRGCRFRQKGWQIIFDIAFQGAYYRDVVVNGIGMHTAYNALAVFGMALLLGCKEVDIREGLLTFSGVQRRMQHIGSVSGVDVFDDYGHHPAEIATTLQAVEKATDGRRVVALLQPHRYSRTQTVVKGYSSAFMHADEIIVTDIYASGE